MKSSEALRLAQKAIETRDSTFVCVALKYKHGSFHSKIRKGYNETAVWNNLQNLFSGYEGSPVVASGTIEIWLKANSKDARLFFNRANSDEIENAMREYRLAWIDWMIEGYEAVGD